MICQCVCVKENQTQKRVSRVCDDKIGNYFGFEPKVLHPSNVSSFLTISGKTFLTDLGFYIVSKKWLVRHSSCFVH